MGNLDINIGKLKKNAFRYSKVRGETASRIRIPGGVIDANSMSKVVEIAEKSGPASSILQTARESRSPVSP